MHFCTAHVAIGGDIRNIMYRDEFAPISWPEMEVLRTIHGDASVSEIRPFVDVKQSPRAERERLAAIYGEEPLQQRWGGKNAPEEMTAPRATLATGTRWINPLSGLMENTGEDGRTSRPIPPAPSLDAQMPLSPAPVETVGDFKITSPETAETENDKYVDEEIEPFDETPAPRGPGRPRKAG